MSFSHFCILHLTACLLVIGTTNSASAISKSHLQFQKKIEVNKDSVLNARIAIFHEDNFPLMGFGVLPNKLLINLKGIKLQAKRLTVKQLKNKQILNFKNFDILILCGQTYPKTAITNILNYLKSGGAAFFIGGPPLTAPVELKNGKWKLAEPNYPFNGAKEMKISGKRNTLEKCPLTLSVLRADTWEITESSPRWHPLASKKNPFDVLEDIKISSKAFELLPALKSPPHGEVSAKLKFYIARKPSLNSDTEIFIPLVTAQMNGNSFPFNIKGGSVLSFIQKQDHEYSGSRMLVWGIMNSGKLTNICNLRNKNFLYDCIKLLTRRDSLSYAHTDKLAYGKGEKIIVHIKNVNFGLRTVKNILELCLENEYTGNQIFLHVPENTTTSRSSSSFDIKLPHLPPGSYKIYLKQNKKLKYSACFAVMDTKRSLLTANSFLRQSSFGITETPAAFALKPEVVYKEYKRNSIQTMFFVFMWGLVEPSKGKYNFTYIDHFAKEAKKNGIKLILDSYYLWSKKDMPSYLPCAVDQYGAVRNDVFDIFAEKTQEGFINLFKALAKQYKNQSAVLGYAISLFKVGPHPYIQGNYYKIFYKDNKVHFLLYSTAAQEKFRTYLRDIKRYSLKDVSMIFGKKIKSWKEVKVPLPPCDIYKKGRISRNLNELRKELNNTNIKEKLMLGKQWRETTDWYQWTYENLLFKIISEIKKISPEKVVLIRSYQTGDLAYKVAEKFTNTGVNAECIGDMPAQMYSNISRGLQNTYGVSTSQEGNVANTAKPFVIKRQLNNAIIAGAVPALYASTLKELRRNLSLLPAFYYQGSLLKDSTPVKSTVGALFPTSIYTHSIDWSFAYCLLRLVFPSFEHLGIPFNVVSSDSPKTTLVNISVLVDLGCNFLLGESQQNAILDWVKQGNTLLCFYNLGKYNELGVENTFMNSLGFPNIPLITCPKTLTFASSKNYKIKINGISLPAPKGCEVLATWDDKSAALIKVPYGKGSIAIAGWTPWNAPTKLMRLFLKHSASIESFIKCLAPANCKIVFQQKKDKLLALIYNEVNRSVNCKLLLNRKKLFWKNQIYDYKSKKIFKLKKNIIKFHMKPYEVKFICFPNGKMLLPQIKK